MIRHTTPDGLPIHPDCAALAVGELDAECTCLDDYDNIESVYDGIAVAERQEARRVADTPRGRGPDLDDVRDLSPESKASDSKAAVNEAGFFKKSEDLRCKAGVDFKKGPLNYDRFKTGPWARINRS